MLVCYSEWMQFSYYKVMKVLDWEVNNKRFKMYE